MPKKFIALCMLLVVSACAGWSIGSNAQREFETGLGLFNVGKYDQAIPHFTKAAELDPEFARAYLFLGRSHLNLKQWTAALSPLRTAFRLSPAETQKEVINVLFDALFGAATSEFKQGNFQASLNHLREGLKLNPQSDMASKQLLSTLFAFGGKQLSEGNFSGAVSSYREIIGMSPGHFDAYLGLARAFFGQGDYLKALQTVQQASRLNPSSPEALMLFQDILKRK